MKQILLKIAYWINKHYHTIEIKNTDIIKYEKHYYSINELSVELEIGCCDVLKIEAFGIERQLR